jgi:hypothetical protein
VTVVVILCLLSSAVFFLVFGLLQARAHERLCWRHISYQPVPMQYHNGKAKNNVVSMAVYEDEDDDDEEVFSTA